MAATPKIKVSRLPIRLFFQAIMLMIIRINQGLALKIVAKKDPRHPLPELLPEIIANTKTTIESKLRPVRDPYLSQFEI
jgi:hypothetical protein